MWFFNFFQKNKTKYKILSIDGGGLKGYFAAYVFYQLKNEFGVDVYNEFDCFSGTSTGSILATAIVGKMDYKEILEMYEKGEETFFVKNSITQRGSKKYFPKYSNKSLFSYAKQMFGSFNFEDMWEFSQKGLIIYSCNLTTLEPVIYTSPNFSYVVNSQSVKSKISDALVASSAAPGYFPLVKMDRNGVEYFADGGLWVNSPALMTQTIIKKRYFLSDANIKHLSIGYVQTSNLFDPEKKKKEKIKDEQSKKIGNVSYLIGACISLTMFLQNFVMEQTYAKSPTKYLRIDLGALENDFPMDKLPEEFKKIAHDAWEDKKHEIKNFILSK